MPTTEMARLQAVVAEQEIPHRVSFATLGSEQVRLDEAIHPLGV
jgi:hypothetical protein